MNYFPTIDKIKYEGSETANMFAFRHYDAEEVVLGKKMKDHLRFAIAYWHTMTQMVQILSEHRSISALGSVKRKWKPRKIE